MIEFSDELVDDVFICLYILAPKILDFRKKYIC